MFEPLIECYKNHEAKLKQMLMWLKFAYMVIFIMMIVFILGFYGTLWWQQANEVHRVLVAFGIILMGAMYLGSPFKVYNNVTFFYLAALSVFFSLGVLFLFSGYHWQHSNYFIAGGAMFTAAALFYNLADTATNKAEDDSKLYLDRYIQTTEWIFKRLYSDQPSRRNCWVTAARLSDDLFDFEERVVSEPDRKFLGIYKRNYFHRIHEFLNTKDFVYFYSQDAQKEQEKRDSQNVNLSAVRNGVTNIDESHIIAILKPVKAQYEEHTSSSKMLESEDKFSVQFLEVHFPEILEYIQDFRKGFSAQESLAEKSH